MSVDFASPLLWAVIIGWIMTVVLHEFAHGVVALWGGDHTIRDRGGLTLNPLQYVDPFMSIILPVIFLLMGGIPLPGGATYVRRDLIRSKAWNSAVSGAGPAMNFLLFLILASLVQPWMGWVDPEAPVSQWSNAQVFVAAMAFLQLFAVLLNLMPIPPLDGFGIIAPYLPADLRARIMQPPMPTILIVVFFFLLISGILSPVFREGLYHIITGLGFEYAPLVQAFRTALWGG